MNDERQWQHLEQYWLVFAILVHLDLLLLDATSEQSPSGTIKSVNSWNFQLGYQQYFPIAKLYNLPQNLRFRQLNQFTYSIIYVM